MDSRELEEQIIEHIIKLTCRIESLVDRVNELTVQVNKLKNTSADCNSAEKSEMLKHIRNDLIEVLEHYSKHK